jgi:LPS sulfotransferase NodH
MDKIFILARPRSGSTALRSLFVDINGLYVFGEIFHYDQHDQPENFQYFLKNRILPSENLRELLIPFSENQEKLFSLYIDHLEGLVTEEESGARTLLAAIHYNNFSVSNTVTHAISDPPLLLWRLTESNGRIIHLVRRNTLASIVSWHLAKQTGVWHVSADTITKTQPPKEISIDVKDLLRSLYSAEVERETYESVLSKASNALTVTYEDLFRADGDLNPSIVDAICQHVRLPKLQNKVAYSKTRGRSLRETIANIKEVDAALRWTPFYWMLDA